MSASADAWFLCPQGCWPQDTAVAERLCRTAWYWDDWAHVRFHMNGDFEAPNTSEGASWAMKVGTAGAAADIEIDWSEFGRHLMTWTLADDVITGVRVYDNEGVFGVQCDECVELPPAEREEYWAWA